MAMNGPAQLFDLLTHVTGVDAYRYATSRSALFGPRNGVATALHEAVSKAEDDLVVGKLQECVDILLDQSLRRGLSEFIGGDAAYENDQALIDFSADRLIRNLTGLIATAKVAVVATRVVLKKDRPDALSRAVEQAVRVLRPTESKGFSGRGGLASIELGTVAQLVGRRSNVTKSWISRQVRP